MESTSETNRLSDRDLFYFRQRTKNRIFQSIIAFFAERAEQTGLTKKEIAARLGKDPAQITRWLSGPGNWTLDTISDLLLAMDSELICHMQAFNQPMESSASSTRPTTQILDAVQRFQQRRVTGQVTEISNYITPEAKRSAGAQRSGIEGGSMSIVAEGMQQKTSIGLALAESMPQGQVPQRMRATR